MATNRDSDRAYLIVNLVLIGLGLAYVLIQLTGRTSSTDTGHHNFSEISALLLIIWLATTVLWLVMFSRRHRQRFTRGHVKSNSPRKSEPSHRKTKLASKEVWSTIRGSTQQNFPHTDGGVMTLQALANTLHQNTIHAEPVSKSKVLAHSVFVHTKPPAEWSLLLLQQLEWLRFEAICISFFDSISLHATSLSIGTDAAISMRIIQPGTKTTYALAKIVSGNTIVDIDPIRALYAAMTQQQVLRGFYLTAGTFTAQARAAARGVGMFSIDGVTLFEKIVSLPLDRQKALLELALDGDYLTPSCPLCRQKMVMWETYFTSIWRCSNYPSCTAHTRATIDTVS